MPFPRAYGYVTPLARRYGYGYALRVNGVSPPPVSARRRRRRRPGPAAGAENFEPPQPIWRLHLHLGAPGRATATASALARAYGYVSTSGDILRLRTTANTGPRPCSAQQVMSIPIGHRSRPIQCTTTYHHLDTLLVDALVRVRLSSDRGIAQFRHHVLECSLVLLHLSQ